MKMPDLPTLPANVLELMQMLRDPKVPAANAIERIAQDQVLTARILKLVNSGYYSVRNKVSSIDHAVALVGFVKVWEMLLSSSVMEMISGKEKNLWLHSYSSSVLMREMVERERIRCSPKIQLTMLMHDLGKIVLLNYNPRAYRKIQDAIVEASTQCHLVEEDQMGVNHAEVAGWLLESWELSDDQIIPISQHHGNELASAYSLETCLVKVADYCDNKVRGHVCEEPPQTELNATGLNELDITDWLERHSIIMEDLGIPDLDE